MKTVSELLSTAIAHHRAGRRHEAELAFRQLLNTNPTDAEIWLLAGNLALEDGRYDVAETRLQRAANFNPASAEAQTNLGLALHFQGKTDKAIGCYRESLRYQPNNAEALNYLGNALGDQGHLDEATRCYLRAIEIAPDYAAAHSNLGTCYLQQNKIDEAVTCHRRALALMPNLAEAHNNLGGALQRQQRLEEAEGCYRRALELNPNIAAAHANLGHIYRRQNQCLDSAAAYRRAIDLRPNYADAHFGLAQTLLLAGGFEEGWREYEWWRLKMDQPRARSFQQPRWTGEPLAGKTILVFTEQGFGDTFQFIRYAALLKERGAYVVLECQKALAKTLARCPFVDRVTVAGDTLPTFDCQVPLMSLPGLFKTNLGTIPRQAPYLFADPALVDQWREKLEPIQGFRIGINWHGRVGQGDFRLRDIPLHFLTSLAENPAVRLISLQKSQAEDELSEKEGTLPIADFGVELDEVAGPFMDTAAIMMNLDLVITSDTAIPHLAGALAVPVWVALPFAPDWRWLLNRSDSPWYPTMRLFRQKSNGDWAGVFQEIEAALRKQIQE